MDELNAQLPRSKSGDLDPLICRVLASATVTDWVNTKNLPHPYSPVAHAWQQTSKAMLTLLGRVDGLTLDYAVDRGDPADVLQPLQDMLYRAAEFVEIAESRAQNVAKAMAITDRVKVSRTVDRLLSIQCNALKHDGDRMGLFRASQHGEPIWGYQLQRAIGGVMDANQELHSRRKAYSFNVEIRRYFALLHLAPESLARPLLSHLGAADNQLGPLSEQLALRVAALPITAFMWEASKDMPDIVLDAAGLRVSLRDGPIVPMPRRDTDCQITFVNDGVSRIYQLPLP